MPEDNEAEESLGAKAFDVFAGHVATDVTDENAKLDEEIAFLRPVRDYLESVEIRAGDRVVALPGLGSAEIDGRGALVIRISGEDGATLPLEEYGFKGKAKLYVSKQIVGEFTGPVNLYLSEGYDDGFLRLTIYDLSGKVGIRGTLQNLSCEDLGKIMSECDETAGFECETIGRYLKEGRGMCQGATFSPDLAFIIPDLGRKSPGIFKSTLLVHFETSLNEHLDGIDTSPAGELRELVFSVDKNPENKAMLRHNRKLRFERQNLKYIQSRIGAIELFFHDGDVSFPLQLGFKVNLGDAEDVWCIPFPSRQTPSIEANKLHFLEVYVSGVHSRRVTGIMLGTNPSDPLSVPFEIRHDSGLCLRARLQFGSRTSLLKIQRTGLLARALSAAITGKHSSPSLPADCAVRLCSIHFSFNSIMDALAMVQLRSDSGST